MKDDEFLVDRYVTTFEKLDGEMVADETRSPLASALDTGRVDEIGWKIWKPLKISSPPQLLDGIYASLPGRFPPLFERLVLSYRWTEVDLQTYRLLGNPPGLDLSGLLEGISGDPGLWEALLPAGYIQFGRGPDLDYDPVCFEMKSQSKGRDCRIVKIDHEEILCNYRVKVVTELAPSFRSLVEKTIALAR